MNSLPQSVQDINRHHEDSQVYQRIQGIIKAQKEAILINKAFLKPIDVALKTYKTQNDKRKIGELPYGLKQAIKLDIDANNFNLKNFVATPNHIKNYEQLIKANCDNLISALKRQESPIKVAVCVCMYSEDQDMLRRTISGIAKNLKYAAEKSLLPHQIAICVIMDGIQAVHDSVIQYMEQLELNSGICYDSDVLPINLEDLRNRGASDFSDDEILNIGGIIFKEDYQDRQKRRFRKRKEEYLIVKQRIRKMEALQKSKNITIDSLEQYVLPYFQKIARNHHKIKFCQDQRQSNNHQPQFFYKQYGANNPINVQLFRKALAQAKLNHKEYIEKRSSLALLTSFRVDIGLEKKKLQKQQINISDGSLQIIKQQSIRLTGDSFDSSSMKMNLFFLTKYKNEGKLSSHNWFLNGFCEEIKPEYSILIDVGLVPKEDAIYKMVDYMAIKKDIGGVCGYMGVRIERISRNDNEKIDTDNIGCISNFFSNVCNIQRAQQLQYHFAHMIDKPFQSNFGFIHVLPGAFSGYRMAALKSTKYGSKDSQLLKNYFESLGDKQGKELNNVEFSALQVFLFIILPQFLYYCIYPLGEQSNQRVLYDNNVYLAEDRTLCLGIYANGYNLTFLPDVYAWVDSMKTLHSLMGQRKRWINGSYFAFSKVTQQLPSLQRSSKLLKIQIKYLQFLDMLNFLAPALFFFTLYTSLQVFTRNYLLQLVDKIVLPQFSEQEYTLLHLATFTICFAFVMIFIGLVIFSMYLTSKSPVFQRFLYTASTLLGIFCLIIFGLLIYQIYQWFSSAFINDACFLTEKNQCSQIQKNVIEITSFLILGIFGLYLIPLVIYSCVFRRYQIFGDLVLGFLAFIYYAPTYLIILNTYALARIDDLSWGTKGLDGDNTGSSKLSESWKKIKLMFIGKYVFLNCTFCFIFLIAGKPTTQQSIQQLKLYLVFCIMVVLALTLFFKISIGFIFNVRYKCGKIIRSRQNKKRLKENKINSYKKKDSVVEVYSEIREFLFSQIKNSITEIKNDYKTINNYVSVINKSCFILQNNQRKKRIQSFMSRIQNKNK